MTQLRELRLDQSEGVPPPISAADECLFHNSMSDVTAHSADYCNARVHFAKKKKFRGIVSFKCMSTEQRKSLWYTSAELKTMKKRQEICAVSSERVLPLPTDIDEINKTFLRSLWLSTTMSTAETDELLRNSEALKQHTEGLNRFLESRESGRGLEEWISTPERYLRQKTARASRMAFIIASSQLATAEKIDEDQDELLAEEYRKQSGAAKLYARIIAEADAQAVVKSQDGSKAQKVVNNEAAPDGSAEKTPETSLLEGT
jgi:hypothetical protein